MVGGFAFCPFGGSSTGRALYFVKKSDPAMVRIVERRGEVFSRFIVCDPGQFVKLV